MLLRAFYSVRRHLRLIRYYSAARRESAWTRANQWVLIASLLLAPVALCAGEALVDREQVTYPLRGSIFGPSQGPFQAVVAGRETILLEPRTHASFAFVQHSHRAGWPFSTTITRHGVSLDLHVFDEPRVRHNVRLPIDSRLRTAITSELLLGGETRYLTVLDGPAPPIRARNWPATLAAMTIWWLLLAGIGAIGAQTLHVLLSMARHHRAQAAARRAGQNRCVGCGYDLRGLGFAQQCPECGSSLY